MTNRELLHATMCGENGDSLLQFELGFNVPYKKWRKKGFPSHIVPTSSGWAELTTQENFYDYFNTSGFLFCRFEEYCIPAHKTKIISNDGRIVRSINYLGNTLSQLCDEQSYGQIDDGAQRGALPLGEAFSITSEKDYLENRFRYIGHAQERILAKSPFWTPEAARNQHDYIVTLGVDGPFGFLREVLGSENAMIFPYEEPELIRMMLRDHLEVAISCAEKLIPLYRPDWTFVWEDCCGSTGPFIAPDIFDELFAWWYREWKDFTRSMGVPWVVLDTDGDPSPLVTRWYNNGIDCMHPWEVNGVNMLKFAEEYPDFVMMGGIYKHMFEPGSPEQVGRFKTADTRKEIDAELERVMKVMKKRGKYIPSLDHWAFWAVEYEDYQYYSNRLLDYGKANQVTRNFIR